jgi:hypothetical protein
VTQPVDKSILQEIVRIIEAQRKVPERVVVRSREYLITYLEDHMNRLDEALRRYDSDRLNMLYGQLASKVKYQMHRMVASRVKVKEAAKDQPVTPQLRAKKAPAVRASAKPGAAKPAAKAVAKKAAAKSTAAKRPAKKAAPAPRPAAVKAGKKPVKQASAKSKARATKKGAVKKTTRAAAKSHK